MASERSYIRFYVIALALLLIGGSAYYFTVHVDAAREETEKYVITTSSPPGGSYAQALGKLLERYNMVSGDLDFELEPLEQQEVIARGEIHTVEQILGREVDLGLIQGDVVVTDIKPPAGASLPPPDIYAIAKLYDEIFVLFTRQEAASLQEVCAAARSAGQYVRTGSLGPGSQVFIDLGNLMAFYQCPWIAAQHQTLDYRQATAALQNGQIDIAFMVAGYLNDDIRALARTEGVRLLALTESEAFVRNFGGIETHTVLPGLFGTGIPAEPVHTVSTPATLIIGGDVDDATVYDLSSFIFANAGQLQLSFRQFDIALPTTHTGAPIHPLALRAHDQRDLNWFERNNALITSILSILGVLTGVATILFQIARFAREARDKKESPEPS